MSEGLDDIELDYIRTITALWEYGHLSLRVGLVGVAAGLAPRSGARWTAVAVGVGCVSLSLATLAVFFLPLDCGTGQALTKALGAPGSLLLMFAARAFREFKWPDLGAWAWCAACALASTPFWEWYVTSFGRVYEVVQLAVAVVLAVALSRTCGWRMRAGALLMVLGAATILASRLA